MDNKSMIIEAQNSDVVYKDGKTKGTLGKLAGVFADYGSETRNGRLYEEKLWDNQIFNSEDVMEALQTKTLFGELDHPEGDRCETLAQNAAISITKLEKKPEEKVIYGEAEILDTPTGRIVKTLADSGAKLGVSSRGLGEEIFKEGREVIDPDTYEFITFDVVITPANTKARVALTESKHQHKITESLENEVANCITENQLMQIKRVVENTELKNKEINEKIDNKLNELKESKEIKKEEKEEKENLTEKNEKIAYKIVKEQVNKLNEEVDYYKNSKNMLKGIIKENNNKEKELNENNEKIKEILEGVKRTNRKLRKQITDRNIELQKEQENKEILNKEISKLKKDKMELKLENKELDRKCEEYKQENKKLDRKCEEYKQENTKLNKKSEDYRNRYREMNSSLLEVKKEVEAKEMEKENNKEKLEERTTRLNETIIKNKQTIEKANKTIEEKEKEISNLKIQLEELEGQRDRFNKLSFIPAGNATMIEENETINYTDEEKALIKAIANK